MPYRVRVFDRIRDIPEAEWNQLTQNHPTPILEWAWLELLERSGSVDTAHGWTPRHLTLWRGSELVAGAPLYLKTHSWGEFVYDFAFAQAAPLRGSLWYPKLVGMSPFTPATGWQILVRAGEDSADLTERWLTAAHQLAQTLGAVSLQFNFTDPGWSDTLTGPWLRWTHQGYLWTNDHFQSFDDYLAVFDKNQRRNIRRERQHLVQNQIELRLVRGEEIPHAWFPLMGYLYEKTNAQFGPYAARFLEPRFFELLDAIRPWLVFAATFQEGDALPLALGFLLTKGSTLLGRYWGERQPTPSQYFNVCYYGPIDWAIRQGIQRFDPGAGSPLKVRRGFQSRRNVSLHHFFEPGARQLFSAYIDLLNQQEEAEIEALNQAIPFRAPHKPRLA